MYQFGFVIFIYFLPEIIYIHINYIGTGIKINSPYIFNYKVTRE